MASLTRRSAPTDLSYLVPYGFGGTESPIRIVPPDADSTVEVVRTLAGEHLLQVWSDNFTRRYLADEEGATRRALARIEADARVAINRENGYTTRYLADAELGTRVTLRRLDHDHEERMASADRAERREARKHDALKQVAVKALEVLQSGVDVQVYEQSGGFFNTYHNIGVRVTRVP